ncbi:MAG: SUF system NifU family Fe-S cluster assembly protein [candidate division KSB1 bacterium]|nr:SUF system NifU family Fe-S cluster assembly protein [candidate division KSB1 bacterium]MDZ7345824.1 SUF system NifU family Fe-S cluster assembly protein [candidate division KSB1 bacterium]
MDLDELYQEIILEHYKQPKNQGELPEPDVVIEGHNPFCGDQIKLTMRMRNGVVEDVKFSGSGCAISQASASVMTEHIKGKTVEEVQKLFREFTGMVKGEDPLHPHIPETDELSAFKGVSAYPTRVKCALLAWNALKEGIEREIKEKK